MSRFRALAPVDVLRRAEEDGPRLRAALDKVLTADDAAGILLSLLVTHTAADADDDAAPCTAVSKKIAFAELMKLATAESVACLLELARFPPADVSLDLYSNARRMPMAALMAHCLVDSAEAVEAVQDADLFTVSDLIRYCSLDVDDAGAADAVHTDAAMEEHVGALALETEGALGRPALRLLISEARKLCAATAALRGTHAGARDEAGRLGGRVPTAWGDDAHDDGGEEDGPLPGTRSVGC